MGQSTFLALVLQFQAGRLMPANADLKIFHAELRAAVRAGVKLEIGEGVTPSTPLSLKTLDKLEGQANAGSGLSARYQAALDVWQASGSMIPILESLSARYKAWQRIGRLFRNSLIYVLIMAVLAIAALVFYQLNILPEIESLRQDLVTIGDPSNRLAPSNAAFWANVALALFVVMLLGLAWWLFNGGVAKAGWWFGGQAYMRCQTLATASRTMQLLIAEGVAPETAATLSGKLAGLDAIGQGELLCAVREREDKDILSPTLSDFLLMIADHQYVAARTWGPGMLVVVIGGVFAFLFVVLTYGPIATLIQDLSNSASL